VNSFRRVGRRGVHQLFDFGDWRDRGGVVLIAVLKAERAEENHWCSCLGEGVSGGKG